MERVANKKTKRIFSKIFWPVVQIVVLFAVATFLINYFSIDRFVKDNAKERLNEAYNDVVSQIDDFKMSGENIFVLQRKCLPCFYYLCNLKECRQLCCRICLITMII